MGSVPTVEFRAERVRQGGRCGPADSSADRPWARGPIYDTYIHAYDIEGDNLYLQDLAGQEAIRMHLYDGQGRLRDTLMITNSLRALAQPC